MIDSKALYAAIAFLSSIVIDALTSLDPPEQREAPSSMRISSVVLIGCLASPPIRARMVYQQRAFFGALLFAVALAAEHEEAHGSRLADAAYTILTLSAFIFTYSSGGIDEKLKTRVSKDASQYVRRECCDGIAVAFLFYSSTRVLRAGIQHPECARLFEVDRDVVGYAVASSTTTCSLSVAGAIGVFTAVLLGSSERVRKHGTSAASSLVIVSAIVQFAAAFVATLALSDQLEGFPSLWEINTACASSVACPFAFSTRRFAIVNACPSAAWTNALGTLLLAHKLEDRPRVGSALAPFSVAAAALLAALLALWIYLGASWEGARVETASIIGVVAVFTIGFVDRQIGVLAFALAVVVDLLSMLRTSEAVTIFSRPEVCCNVASTALLCAYASFSGNAASSLAIAGASISTLVFVVAGAVVAAYSGDVFDVGPSADVAASFLLQCYLPLLSWVSALGRKPDVHALGVNTRRGAWLLSPAVPIAAWAAVLLASGTPPSGLWSVSNVWIAIAAGVAPWLALGLF